MLKVLIGFVVGKFGFCLVFFKIIDYVIFIYGVFINSLWIILRRFELVILW